MPARYRGDRAAAARNRVAGGSLVDAALGCWRPLGHADPQAALHQAPCGRQAFHAEGHRARLALLSRLLPDLGPAGREGTGRRGACIFAAPQLAYDSEITCYSIQCLVSKLRAALMRTPLGWRDAGSLEELGGLTTAWLEGKLKEHPCDGDEPDPETLEILADLLHFNRHGLVTTFSQPAEGIDETGSGQRAAVEGLAQESVARAIGALGLYTDLLVFLFEPGGEGGYMLPITTEEFHPFTWCGAHEVEAQLQGFEDVCSKEGLAAILNAWTVIVIDPKWGRKRYLWNHLRRALVGRDSKAARWRVEPSPHHDLEVDFVR